MDRKVLENESKNLGYNLPFNNVSFHPLLQSEIFKTSNALYQSFSLLTLVPATLTLILCVLAHPKYFSVQPLFLVRKFLAVVIASCWLVYPIVNPVFPLEVNVRKNLGRFLVSFLLMSKSIDWGFSETPTTYSQHHKSFKSKLGKDCDDTHNSEELTSAVSISEKLEWIFVNLTTLRGLQLSWGQDSKLNHKGFKEEVLKLFLCQFISISTLYPLLWLRDFYSNSPTRALMAILRLPEFYGLSFIARCLHTIVVITSVCTIVEAANSTMAVLGHIIHPISKFFKFPTVICDFWNPLYYPPLFSNVLQLNSVASFWGKSWHQSFRRAFLVCGAVPATKMAQSLGASKKLKAIASLLGAFAASGFLHSYPLYLMSDPLTQDGKISTLTKFGLFICFPLQALGIVLEPLIIPMIPKRIGGEKLWTAAFLTFTLSLLTREVTKVGRLSSLYPSPELWTWKELAVPAFFSPMIL